VPEPNEKKLDFLKREEIKTMSKDIAALREKEAGRQREKVSKISIEEKIEKKPVPEPTKKVFEEPKRKEEISRKIDGEAEARRRIAELLQKQEEIKVDEPTAKPEFPKRQEPPPVRSLNEKTETVAPLAEPEIKEEAPNIQKDFEAEKKKILAAIEEENRSIPQKGETAEPGDTVAETEEDLVFSQPKAEIPPVAQIKEQTTAETAEKEAIERLKAEAGKQGIKQGIGLPKLSTPKSGPFLKKFIVRFILLILSNAIIFFILTFWWWYFKERG